jgi:putative endonuclease
VYSLVYFEQYDDMYSAICRERQLKRWNRAWKLELIEKNNPKWDDLYLSIL